MSKVTDVKVLTEMPVAIKTDNSLFCLMYCWFALGQGSYSTSCLSLGS